MIISKSAVEKAIGSIGRRDYRDPEIQRIAQKALERKRIKKPPKVVKRKIEPKRKPIISKKDVEKLIGSIGRRDYRDPEIQRLTREAMRRKEGLPKKPELPKRVAPTIKAPVKALRLKAPPVKLPPVKPVKIPLLPKQSVERLIGSIGRRDYRDPEIQRLAKEAMRRKRIKKPPKVVKAPIKRKIELKRRIEPPKIMMAKKYVEELLGSIGRRDYRDPEIQRLAKEADKKRIFLFKDEVKKLLGSIGRRDYRDPEIQRLAREELKKRGITKTEIRVFEKPEIPKEVKVSPKPLEAVPIVTKPDVVPMAQLMDYPVTEPYRLPTPEEKAKIEKDRKLKEDARKIQAIKEGKRLFEKMKKEGTVEQFKGLLASGMRPWSYEVAGMQVAENRGEVKKGSTQMLLLQRVGEEIIQAKKEGVMKLGKLDVSFSSWGVPSFKGTGYIGKLIEAPVSVIGTPVVMAGVGSAFTGARGALAKHSTKIATAFDAVMLGMGAYYVYERGGEIKHAVERKDMPKVYEKVMLTMGELGGLIVGAKMVEGVPSKVKFKPRGLLRAKLKPAKTIKNMKIDKGEVTIGVENPKGELLNVKGKFESTTKEGISEGSIKIPEQIVDGTTISPKKIVLKPDEIVGVLNYAKLPKAKIPPKVGKPPLIEGLDLIGKPYVEPTLSYARVEEVKIPTVKGEQTVWKGLVIADKPIIGRIPKGKLEVGVPKKIKIKGVEEGYNPVSVLETTLMTQKNIMKEMGFVKSEINKVSTAMDVMKVTKKQPSRFVEKEFIKETKSLSPRGVKDVLNYVKLNKIKPLVEQIYGSFVARVQLMPHLRHRIPADIDIHLKTIKEADAIIFTRTLMTRLKSIGEKVRISKEYSTLIEAKGKNGKWHHAVDIHYKGEPTTDPLSPNIEGGYGFLFGQKTIPIEGVPSMRLSEMGLRKGTSVLGWRGKKIAPAKHRVKDIIDFYYTQLTLIESMKRDPLSFLQRSKIEKVMKELKDWKKLYPKIDFTVPEAIKIPLIEKPSIPKVVKPKPSPIPSGYSIGAEMVNFGSNLVSLPPKPPSRKPPSKVVSRKPRERSGYDIGSEMANYGKNLVSVPKPPSPKPPSKIISKIPSKPPSPKPPSRKPPSLVIPSPSIPPPSIPSVYIPPIYVPSPYVSPPPSKPPSIIPSKPPSPKPSEKIKKGVPLFAIPGFPMGLDLGYSIDENYKTITKHTKHKLATIEDLLKM